MRLFHLCALNQKPEHDGQFGEERRLQPGEAGDDQPNAQQAGQETGAKNKQAERKEPYAPENLTDELPLTVQSDEQHGECVTLRFIEYGQKFAATKKNNCRDIVQCIQEE